MKVLWFAITPCGATDKLAPDMNLSGWLKSLEEELVKSELIELSVGFYWNVPLEPFQLNRTTYYPVLRTGGKSKFNRMINRLLDNIHDDNKEIPRLLNIIQKIRPDIIHVHGTEDNFGLIQSVTNIPVCISIQGIQAPIIEKYYSGISSSEASINEGIIPKLLFKSAGYWKKYMVKCSIREKKILSQTKNILGRTDWDRRITRLFAPSSRYHTSEEILRPAFYQNRWEKLQFSNPLELVTIISGGIYKGLESIVKTSRILKSFSFNDFKWTIIGPDESSYFARLVKNVTREKYEYLNITFLGNKNENEIVDILKLSDIYCQVSHIENSPNSLCEAMLLGMPVMATFAGGTESLLENRKEGILVQDGDPYSMAGTIIDLQKNFGKALRMAEAAHQRAIKRHSQKSVVDELIRTYERIIKDVKL